MKSRPVFSALLFVLFSAKSSGDDNCKQSSSAGTCSNVGSLKGMLTFINSVTQSLGQIVESAKLKADAIEDGFCGNKKVDGSETGTGALCLRAEPDCYALYLVGFRKSGVYRIWPRFFNHSVLVYCDMVTDNGGWTVIQRRGDYGDPPRNFFETWENYKKGFGNIEEDFWLGNDLIFAMTNQAQSVLRIDLEDFDNEKRFAKYQKFLVRSEVEKYLMTIGEYEGTAGDSLRVHSDKIFITKDAGGGCANDFKGGWWYAGCHEANLNGLYHRGGDHSSYADGVNWYKFRGYNNSMKTAEMKIRPCNC